MIRAGFLGPSLGRRLKVHQLLDVVLVKHVRNLLLVGADPDLPAVRLVIGPLHERFDEMLRRQGTGHGREAQQENEAGKNMPHGPLMIATR